MNTTAARLHDFALGFLSGAAEGVRDEVRARYSEWRTVLLRTTEHAVSVQHELVVHVDDQREVFAAALFARLIASCQAAVILLERGLVAQARCVLRPALEALFALAAIAEKPELVARLIESHEAEQRRAAKNLGYGCTLTSRPSPATNWHRVGSMRPLRRRQVPFPPRS